MNPSSSPAAKSYAPWYIVLFFVTLTAILGGFVTIALRTHTGVVTDAAYEKGLAYNRTLEKAAAEKAIGWNGALDTIQSGTTTILRFTLNDKTGKPITNATIKAFLVRPTQAGMDIATDMKADGNAYVATITLPAHGLWEAHISALKDTIQFQFEKTLQVP